MMCENRKGPEGAESPKGNMKINQYGDIGNVEIRKHRNRSQTWANNFLIEYNLRIKKETY